MPAYSVRWRIEWESRDHPPGSIHYRKDSIDRVEMFRARNAGRALARATAVAETHPTYLEKSADARWKVSTTVQLVG